jgi:molybdopterin-guanine dinucleotide biosynthesis protein A
MGYPLYGLVLAGGKSTRMGEDKSLISYFGLEHRIYLAKMIAPFCEKTYISCQENQLSENLDGCNPLIDLVPSKGPMSGLISAFLNHPNAAWLVIPCDLPLFSAKNITQLITERNVQGIATVFSSESHDYPEPLIGIWEPSAFPLIEQQYKVGNYSLLNILNNNHIFLVPALDPEGLTNVNTPEEKRALSLLHPSVQF